MRSLKPNRESAMVTGEGGLGLDARPYDRKLKRARAKLRNKPLTYGELERHVRRLILDNDV